MLTGNATTSSSTTGNAASVTNGVYTTDTSTVTNTMLAGSIANAKLVNSSTTVGTTAIALGASSTTLAGLTSVTSTTLTGWTTTFAAGDVFGFYVIYLFGKTNEPHCDHENFSHQVPYTPDNGLFLG